MRFASRCLFPLALACVADAQVHQVVELTAQEVNASDIFGYDCAFDGLTAVVSAPYDNVPTDNEGSIHVFELVDGVWTRTIRLTASDHHTNDSLGVSVAVDGDIIVAGAPGHDGGGQSRGAAYVFERIAGVWQQTARLQGSNTVAGDIFGVEVAIDGQRIVVSSPIHDTGDGFNFGGVYIFERAANGWEEVAAVHPATVEGAIFQLGTDLAIDGDRIIAGGSFSDTGFVDDAGSASVIERVGGIWQITHIIEPPVTIQDALFGSGVDVSGDTIIIGSEDEAHDGLLTVGAAYLYHFDGASWNLAQKLLPDPIESGANFGADVDLDGDVAMVCGYLEDAAGSGSGSAYVFQRQAGQWNLFQEFVADNTDAGDLFGWRLDMANGMALVGAPFRDTRGLQAGAAYIFDGLPAPCAADIDGDGDADGDDFFAYLDLFAASDPDADLDGDGDRDADDFFMYLDAFSAGC